MYIGYVLFHENWQYTAMTKINNTIIAKELNDECKNKHNTFFQEWDTDDIDIKNSHNRNYCLVDVKHNIICEKCTGTLNLYIELHKLIVKTEADIETFNKILKMYHTHQKIK